MAADMSHFTRNLAIPHVFQITVSRNQRSFVGALNFAVGKSRIYEIMATIVRVKRRRDEKPADSLVFSRKRARLESGAAQKTVETDQEEQVFKFAGTVKPKVRLSH